MPCAKVLADRYPGATFLCMARKPHQSCQSGLNFIHSDSHPALGRLDWRLVNYLLGEGEREAGRAVVHFLNDLFFVFCFSHFFLQT